MDFFTLTQNCRVGLMSNQCQSSASLYSSCRRKLANSTADTKNYLVFTHSQYIFIFLVLYFVTSKYYHVPYTCQGYKNNKYEMYFFSLELYVSQSYATPPFLVLHRKPCICENVWCVKCKVLHFYIKNT